MATAANLDLHVVAALPGRCRAEHDCPMPPRLEILGGRKLLKAGLLLTLPQRLGRVRHLFGRPAQELPSGVTLAVDDNRSAPPGAADDGQPIEAESLHPCDHLGVADHARVAAAVGVLRRLRQALVLLEEVLDL